ncbi:hypothetical protein KHC17_03065 [Agrobacterium salinitolerans]|uniref:Uncharacterized protein n=1 Tax=Agrobacterium salinitolerans TaxID=1183413 RepID=A0A4Z1QLT3_9HYPH|nr:hypothetical protein [Agrobacterium salinitolerans]QXC49090.1 hypothetical protein KHC17_03065 [Agrobacterium salinitolerans]UYZ09283.1 hypothetical protein CFBP5507_16415 [Agrobacterium salinitolerans]
MIPTTQDWNWHVLMLVQALLGVISANFRMITLQFNGDVWLVKAILQEENSLDREEFSDAVEEFSIFMEDIKDKISQDSFKKIVSSTFVDGGSIDKWSDECARVVFRRRERFE